MDWEFIKSTKKCQTCQKNFQSDESYFSALFVLGNPPETEATKKEVVQPQPVPEERAGQARPSSTKKSKQAPIIRLRRTGPSTSKTAEEIFSRQDYCRPCWEHKTDAPFLRQDKPFSFWQSKLALKNKPKTPKEILVSCFDNLINPPPKAEPAAEASSTTETQPPAANSSVAPELRPKVIYLFSLILLRKKILKLKESKNKDGQEFLIMEKTGLPVKQSENQPAVSPSAVSSGPNCKAEPQIYEIPDLKISEEELVLLRNEFTRLFEFEL